MSSSEERMLILKMLEEGKINSEQAARLIEALGGAEGAKESANKQNKSQADFNDEISKMREKIKGWKDDIKRDYNEKEFDKMVDDMAKKAEKVGKSVASTTFGIVDRLVDYVGSFVDTNSFNIFGGLNAVDKTYEAVAKEGLNLEVEGINGSITLRKHLGDKILIRSRIRSMKEDKEDIVQFSEEEDKLTLAVNKSATMSVSHEIFLPYINYGSIKLKTANGRIYVEEVKGEALNSETANSNVELMAINCQNIRIATKNAKVQLNYIVGKSIDVDTTNAVIDIKHIKADELKAATKNGRILVENVQNNNESKLIDIKLKNTNGGIKLNVNDMENRGYKVKGKTTNGNINLLIPEMIYHNINRSGFTGSFVEAESNGYEVFENKVNIDAETSNGVIEVVK